MYSKERNCVFLSKSEMTNRGGQCPSFFYNPCKILSPSQEGHSNILVLTCIFGSSKKQKWSYNAIVFCTYLWSHLRFSSFRPLLIYVLNVDALGVVLHFYSLLSITEIYAFINITKRTFFERFFFWMDDSKDISRQNYFQIRLPDNIDTMWPLYNDECLSKKTNPKNWWRVAIFCRLLLSFHRVQSIFIFSRHL